MRIAGATPYRAALIDDKVISSQQGVKYVFVVKPDNTLERRNIETGTMFEGKRIVKSGLKDGEKVVSTRLQLVQPGMTVKPVEEKSEAECGSAEVERKNHERAGFKEAHEGLCAAGLEACGRFAENDIGAGAGVATRSLWNVSRGELPRRSSRKIRCALSLQTRRCRRRSR